MYLRAGHHGTMTRRLRPLWFFAALLALSGCSGPTSQPSQVDPTGPPTIRPEVVADHADQFDKELSDRRAGSQEEQAASQYVLGHLQQAGYFVRLDAVPVGDLVESTNLDALPPNGEAPTAIVTVGYDAATNEAPLGSTVGTFLELARALYAAEPEHRVEFVALGAETTADHLGSRRLAQQLRDEGSSVDVVSIVPGGPEVGATGDLAAGFLDAARAEGIPVGDPPEIEGYGVDVFDRAGFNSMVVCGAPEDLGAVLISWLTRDDG